MKSVAQQTLGAMHRLRSAWLATRTGRINTLRGLLREFGVVIPLGAKNLLPAVRALLEDADSEMPDALRSTIESACVEIRELTKRILEVEAQLKRLAAPTPVVERLQTIPGVGLLTSTGLMAFVGEVRRFPSARHFASYLGLTPRERSSGSVRRLGSISKRGDAYLRMLLIHGARAVLRRAPEKTDPDRLRAWAIKVEKARGHNKASIALANKLARIVWAVWRNDVEFEETAAA